MNHIKYTIQDIFVSSKNYEFWVTYGNNDIAAKYRRTKLGQLWITLTIAIFIIVIGGIFRGAFYSEYDIYLAYLSIGYISWIFMHDCIIGSCSVLVQAKPIILQKKILIPNFIFKLIYKELLVLSHHILLLPIIFIWLGYSISISGLIFGICGLILTIFTAFWVSLFLSIVCLRYLDLTPLITSLIRIAFFATPIVWIDSNIGRFGELVIMYNPFGYFLKIIRDPLLGYGFPIDAWIIAVVISVFCALTSIITLSITKDKLSYWL